jgi:hypothetical protein
MIDDPNWPMEYEATFGEGNQPSDRGVIRFVCQTGIAAGADQYCRTDSLPT